MNNRHFVSSWYMKKKNGLSTEKILGKENGVMPMVVAAAAVVPISSTSIAALCSTCDFTEGTEVIICNLESRYILQYGTVQNQPLTLWWHHFDSALSDWLNYWRQWSCPCLVEGCAGDTNAPSWIWECELPVFCGQDMVWHDEQTPVLSLAAGIICVYDK